jgi:hypothetical protein
VLAAGLEVGWSDPRSGRFVLRRPDLEEAFWAEVTAEFQAARAGGRQPGKWRLGKWPLGGQILDR